MAKVKFTLKDIREQAIGNAGGLWYNTLKYLKSKGMSVEEWEDFVGKEYAPGWDELKGKGAFEVLKIAALNWVSCGAELITLKGDEQRAEAVLQWPPEGWTGIPIQEAHTINNVLHPIARRVGLKSSWKSEGNQFRLVFFK